MEILIVALPPPFAALLQPEYISRATCAGRDGAASHLARLGDCRTDRCNTRRRSLVRADSALLRATANSPVKRERREGGPGFQPGNLAKTLVGLALLAAAGVAGLSSCGPSWREYRSAEGKFAVLLPGEDVLVRKTEDDGVTVHVVMVNTGDATFAVGWYDIADPGKPVGELLKERQDKILREGGFSRPWESSEISLVTGSAMAPGRGFSTFSIRGYISCRLYAVGSRPLRIYQLVAGTPHITGVQRGNISTRADSDIRRFFDSFKLIE